MATIFNSSLFMGLPEARQSKTLAQFLYPLGINRNTWSSWVQNGDLPIVKMLDICKHYGYDPQQFLVSDTEKKVNKNRKPQFRTRLFSNALSLFRNLTVTQACKSLGISTATFARQLRNTNDGTPSLSVRKYLEWCAKAGLNPTDYIYEGDVTMKFNY